MACSSFQSPTPFPVSRFKIRESAIDLKQSESSFENVGSYEAEDFGKIENLFSE